VTIVTAINLGISRGIYSHESGLGSSAIAVAAARTNSPHKQGIISMAGAFLTVVVCTMTGLVLIVTCEDTAIFTAARAFEGISITSCAFGTGLKMMELGKHIVNISIIFFAFTTIIGWNYYGEKCIQYLGGDKAIIPYKFLFIIFVAVGPFLKIDVAFVIADIVIAWMMIPNVISIVKLRNVITADLPEMAAKKTCHPSDPISI
jgi:AGCS family alanine or glycine:cation symporter